MARHIPIVRDGILHGEAEQEASLNTVVVESNAWYSWLECHDSFRFECSTSTFTARKEQRAGSWYWYGYRRRDGRLHTAYLGRSEELSATRLQVIAAELAGVDGSRTPRTAESERVPALPASHSPRQANVTTSGSLLLHNLGQLTSLIGREQEVVTATALLQRQEVRLLTLVGTAGVGKTRLALQVAFDLLESFPDGVFFVALAPIRDPDLVLSSVAQTLGLRVTGDQPILEVLKVYLSDRSCLLVLDNFEQVVSAAPQLPELLRACPGVKLLVTSREVLHLRAEHQFSVPPLALPDFKRLQDEQALAHVPAVELFVQRVQAVSPDFYLTPANAATIAEICIRLDGLPLAIELAAARIKVFPPQALLARLHHRLQVLTGGARDLPERQRTLRSTIAWSYGLLPAEEQRLFRRLSVFVGGCTLEAVEALSTAVGDTDVNVLEGMISLVDKSLLQQTEQDGKDPRFTMLETIREYGMESLGTSGEMEITHEAHTLYYLRLTEEAALHFFGEEMQRWFAHLERDYPNLRAALQWALERKEAERILRLSTALYYFWSSYGMLDEACQWLEQALSVGGEIDASVRANVLKDLGLLLKNQGEYEQAERLLEESVALYRELGDMVGMARSLRQLAIVLFYYHGECRRACLLLEECLAHFSTGEDQWNRATALCHLAYILNWQGEYVKARPYAEESLALFRGFGNKASRIEALFIVARGLFHAQTSEPTVHALLEEYAALAKGISWASGMVGALLAEIALSQGHIASAYGLILESVAYCRATGLRPDLAEVLVVFGRITAAQGDYRAAQALYEESLALAREVGFKLVIPAGLEGLASVIAAQGEPARAARLWGAAEAFRDTMETPLPPVYQADYECSVAAARTHIGEQAFAAAWAEGRAMTPEQALAAPWPVAMPTRPPAEPSSIPHPPKSPALPNGLTARELEVLRLLAQGLTSAQIAERLVIGLVTVNSHVRSIYSKLGATSRSAATRYAIEHHLV